MRELGPAELPFGGKRASSRGYVEVFVSPVLDQVAGIQGVLVTLRHELVHAAGRRGHGKAFKALAVELEEATTSSPSSQSTIGRESSAGTSSAKFTASAEPPFGRLSASYRTGARSCSARRRRLPPSSARPSPSAA